MYKISICIPTLNRGDYIGETLESIVSQLENGVEVVIIDGGSLDKTESVVDLYQKLFPAIRYIKSPASKKQPSNEGFDRDCNYAVEVANGEYCWLMTDDDLLLPGAISRVLQYTDGTRDLIIANAEVRNIDFTKVLEARRLNIFEDKDYGIEERDTFLATVGSYVSFVGGVIIRRDLWMERDRKSYYGTLFIHVGVIFQHPPLQKTKVIADPLIIIRYGNAMWMSRGFEIWMFKWPELIWSFPDFSSKAKEAVCSREPWKRMRVIFLHRAMGGYTRKEFDHFFSCSVRGIRRILLFGISIFPAKIANFVVSLYFVFVKRKFHMDLDSLLRSPNATWASRFLARFLSA
jgi:glycosyltransferase involved in cell wall biosynthesis